MVISESLELLINMLNCGYPSSCRTIGAIMALLRNQNLFNPSDRNDAVRFLLSIVGIKGILRNHMLRQMSVGQP